jgi:phospholipid transport system substrate-binding protein
VCPPTKDHGARAWRSAKGFERGEMKLNALSAVGLGILFFVLPARVAAETPGDAIRQTVDRILTILKDPQLKGENRKEERRRKLREIIYPRFDFTEMARRSLGSNWRRQQPEQQQEFVKLFTALLEDAYLDTIESYNGEKIQYVKERQDGNYAEVDTKIIDLAGREFSVDYRLHKVDGEWKVYDVVTENVSLVNNYRSQFNRVLTRSSFDELLARMREKAFTAPKTKSARS